MVIIKLIEELKKISIDTKEFDLSYISTDNNLLIFDIKNIFTVLEHLLKFQKAIIGGDILIKNSKNEIIYAYEEWGNEYHFLNWYCDQESGEAYADYKIRSHEIALKTIQNVIKISKEKNDCLIRLLY